MLTTLVFLAALQVPTATPIQRPPTDAEFRSLRSALDTYSATAGWRRLLFDVRWNDSALTAVAIDQYANIGPHRSRRDRSHAYLPDEGLDRGPATALHIGAIDRRDADETGGFLVHEIRAWAEAIPGAPIRARRVRIVLPGTSRTLSLAEVELVGAGIDRSRLRASQSSDSAAPEYQTHPPQISGAGGHAIRALDGHRSSFGPLTCATTQREDDPWWEVDLGATALIEGLRIHGDTRNPADLAGFVVILFDEDGESLWRSPACPPAAARLDRPVEVGPAWRRPLQLRAHSATSQAPGQTLVDALDGDPDPRRGWSLEEGTHEGSVVVLLPPEGLDGADLFVELGQAFGDWRLIGRLLVEVTYGSNVLPALPDDIWALQWNSRRADPWSARTRRTTALLGRMVESPGGAFSLSDADLLAQAHAAVEAAKETDDGWVARARQWLNRSTEVLSFDARLELAAFVDDASH